MLALFIYFRLGNFALTLNFNIDITKIHVIFEYKCRLSSIAAQMTQHINGEYLRSKYN